MLILRYIDKIYNSVNADKTGEGEEEATALVGNFFASCGKDTEKTECVLNFIKNLASECLLVKNTC